MGVLIYLFAGAVLLAAALAGIAIWSRRRLLPKVAAVALSLAFMPAAYAGLVELLSKPKPVKLEWVNAKAEEAEVLGASIREGEGIYLWLQMAGVSEPRAYVLPWDRDLAEKLQEALREAERQGGGLRMRLPFEPSLDPQRPKFYALPQPALPPKDEIPSTAPRHYRHPSLET